jgi:uridine kinase
VQPPPQSAAKDAIVLIDGIFLLRPALLAFWDLTIYLDVNFEKSIERGVNRDAELLGSLEVARLRYQKRYVPGQKMYFRDAHPLDKADILIDNSILEYPRLLRRPEGYLYHLKAR